MANYKVLATWDISIQNLYKDITLIQQGISCKLNISLRSISRVTVNYKVGNEYVTDLCTIDLDNNKVIVPFKKNVLEVGTHALELVCHMKNGDVLPTPNYSYTVTKSLTNDNDITEEDAYPVLIGMIQELTKNEAVIQANEEARANAEMYRELNEDERQNAEVARKANEDTRISNENVRITNENTRQSNETERITAEATRQSNESTRISKEAERLAEEVNRQEAEASRVTAENTRINRFNEMSEFVEGYESEIDDINSQLSQNADSINNLVIDFGAKGIVATYQLPQGANITNGADILRESISLSKGLYVFHVSLGSTTIDTPNFIRAGYFHSDDVTFSHGTDWSSEFKYIAAQGEDLTFYFEVLNNCEGTLLLNSSGFVGTIGYQAFVEIIRL